MIGWFVVHRAASTRQSRQELRDFITKLCEIIYNLQDVSIAYWNTSGRDKGAEAKMIHMSQRITALSYILSNFEHNFDEIKLLSMELKIAATGATFEQNNREQSVSQIYKIRSCTADFTSLLERKFFGKYRK